MFCRQLKYETSTHQNSSFPHGCCLCHPKPAPFPHHAPPQCCYVPVKRTVGCLGGIQAGPVGLLSEARSLCCVGCSTGLAGSLRSHSHPHHPQSRHVCVHPRSAPGSTLVLEASNLADPTTFSGHRTQALLYCVMRATGAQAEALLGIHHCHPQRRPPLAWPASGSSTRGRGQTQVLPLTGCDPGKDVALNPQITE